MAHARDAVLKSIKTYVGQRISDIGTQRNQLSLVYRLPIEVLTLIFEMVTQDPVNLFQINIHRKSPYNISLVSKQWRDVVLNTSLLWTKIDAVNIRHLGIFLARSKDAPLDIELYEKSDRDWLNPKPTLMVPHVTEVERTEVALRNTFLSQQRPPSSYPEIFLTPLIPFISRLKVLKIPAVSLSQLKYFSSPAPHLEILHIGGVHHYYAALPPLIFGGHTPKLWELCSLRLPVPLSHPILTGLRSIHLKSINYMTSPLRDFISVLHSCPRLHDLALIDLIFSQDFAALAPADLPFVDVIHLEDLTTSTVHGLLASIIIPPSSTLALIFNIHCDLRDLFPLNTENLGNLTSIHQLDIEYGRRHGKWHVNLYGVDDLSAIHMEIRLVAMNSNNDLDSLMTENMLKNLKQSLPIPALDSVVIKSVIKKPTPRLLAAALNNFPSVRHVTLWWCTSEALLALVALTTSPLCPALESLRFIRLRATKDDVLAVVASRQKLADRPDSEGKAIRFIELSDCLKVDDDLVPALEDLGVKVEITTYCPEDQSDDEETESESESISIHEFEPVSESESESESEPEPEFGSDSDSEPSYHSSHSE